MGQVANKGSRPDRNNRICHNSSNNKMCRKEVAGLAKVKQVHLILKLSLRLSSIMRSEGIRPMAPPLLCLVMHIMIILHLLAPFLCRIAQWPLREQQRQEALSALVTPRRLLSRPLTRHFLLQLRI